MRALKLVMALMMVVLFSGAAMAAPVTIKHGGGVLTGTLDTGGLSVDINGDVTIYVVEDLTGGTCTPSAAVVSPTTISKSITEGGNASSQTVSVRDNCNNNLSYTANVTSGGTWISAPSSGAGTMSVTFNTSTLPAGPHTGNINVTPAGYPVQPVAVNLTVNPDGGGGENAILLSNGVLLRGVSIDAGGTHYFYFTLPAGTSGVQISIGTYDWETNQDMIVSYGLPAPDPNGYPIGVYYTCDDNPDWWCEISATSSDETVRLRSNVQSGTYYIMVHNTSSMSGLYVVGYSAF